MPSREARRRLERKAEQKSVQEKRLERHPAIFVISLVILVVVIISFIFYTSAGGIGSGFRSDMSFGRYGSKEISLARSQRSVPLNYFTSRLDVLTEANQKDTNQKPTRQVWRQAFDAAAFHYAVFDIARSNGYMVSKDKIIDALQFVPQFINRRTGEFDINEYDKHSPIEKTQTNSIIEEQLIQRQFIDDVLFSRHASGKEVEFYKSMGSPERRFSFVAFKHDQYPIEKVSDYIKANATRFKSIKLARILLIGKSQREAEDIQNRYNLKEKSFEDLAKTHSNDLYASKGGDMGLQYYYQLQEFIDSDEALRNILSLKRDEVTMIKNGENWEIYKCIDPATDPDPNDSSLKTRVLDYMKRFERGVIEDYSIGLAKTFRETAISKSFDEACKEVNQYPAPETEFFPINLGRVVSQDQILFVFPSKIVKVKGSGSSLFSTAFDKQFFQDAFSLSRDTVSNPILLDDQVVLLKLIEERTLTEEDWVSSNTAFKSGIQLAIQGYTLDPVIGEYLNNALIIIQENNLPPLYFFGMPGFGDPSNMRLFGRADRENSPYEYAFYSTISTYMDLSIVINEAKTKLVIDEFDEGFNKSFASGGVQ